VKGIIIKEITALPSMCGKDSRMRHHSVFELFMDMASEHAEILGIGGTALMARGQFWLTVRTRVVFYRRPALMSRCEASTWPGRPGRLRCERYYTLSDAQGLCAEGKTEWAVIDTASGRLCPTGDVYPAELVFHDDAVCTEPFLRLKEDVADAVEIGRITVRATDIDMGGHMNNCAYVRALMSLIPSDAAEDISSIEIAFRTSCYEGDELTVFVRQGESAAEYVMMRTDGKAAAVVKIER